MQIMILENFDYFQNKDHALTFRIHCQLTVKFVKMTLQFLFQTGFVYIYQSAAVVSHRTKHEITRTNQFSQ